MKIALDYDGTFTEDPQGWIMFIGMFRRRGHEVIVATMRFREEGEEVDRWLSDFADRIIFTGRKSKINYLADMGIYPDVWIDDNPIWLFQDE